MKGRMHAEKPEREVSGLGECIFAGYGRGCRARTKAMGCSQGAGCEDGEIVGEGKEIVNMVV
jgi:hypothetical protein